MLSCWTFFLCSIPKQCAHQGLPELINLISKWYFQRVVALPESNLDPHIKSNFQTHYPCCPPPSGSVNTWIWCDFFCHLVAIWILDISNKFYSAIVIWCPFFTRHCSRCLRPEQKEKAVVSYILIKGQKVKSFPQRFYQILWTWFSSAAYPHKS